MLFATVLIWRLDTTDSDWMSGAKPVHITWSGESYATWTMTTQVGENTEDFQIHDIADYAAIPLIVVGAVEIMMLVSAGFGTRNIRRKLRPLNDLAVRAEALSNMSSDEGNLEHLEEELHAPVYHMSGKMAVSSRMIYRNPAVSMGEDSSSEYRIWRTDEEEVRKARAILG